MPLPEKFDAFVPSNFVELLAQSNFQPAPLKLAELRELDSSIVTFGSSLKLAEKLYSQLLFNHCQRCYYFALAILSNGFPSNSPSVPQIPRETVVKELYLTCLLHDFGLSTHIDTTTHPAHDMTFEFHGGIMAYEHLRAEYISTHQLNDIQIADITQSIMLHTAPFEHGKSSALGMLMQLSAFLDVFGYGVFGPDSMEKLIHRDTVREIEQAFPRGDMAQLDRQSQIMFEEKPNCLTSHFLFHKRPLLGSYPVADSHRV
ncbi:hypothetical protein GYMLUDRAFT_241215 [Collybiopsis luxurians FD-317 M1]|uniref:HD domain-containing protein n=1 Tax=Collybiopsis luxurians FD-317 M1 TaxID=944289 RepID=A0A0D0C758_9AGAR|nr:hypothetical protein GYMLUDRAFT_241215 [Collybiopsis luxurians FD-317 M1]